MPVLKALKNGVWTAVNSIDVFDTGWLPLPGELTNAGGFAYYRRIGKTVTVTIQGGNVMPITTGGTTLGTLPEGCRPYFNGESRDLQFAGAPQGTSNQNEVLFRIYTSGVVSAMSTNQTGYYSGTFTFIAD